MPLEAKRVPRDELRAARRSALLLSALSLAFGAPAGAVSISFSHTTDTLLVGGAVLVQIDVGGVPQPGLAAFQLEVQFDPNLVSLANPNAGFEGALDPFAPLGDEALCEQARGRTPCPDPPWLLTSTGRSALGTSSVDGAAGSALIAYASFGLPDPPIGGGTIAILELTGLRPGAVELSFGGVILADNAPVPGSFAVDPMGTSLVVVPEPTAASTLLFGLVVLAVRCSPRRR